MHDGETHEPRQAAQPRPHGPPHDGTRMEGRPRQKCLCHRRETFRRLALGSFQLMHVHILGVGAVGTLIATHLRAAVRQGLMMRAFPPRSPVRSAVAAHLPDAAKTTITLHMREKAFARSSPVFRELRVNHDGACMSV